MTSTICCRAWAKSSRSTASTSIFRTRTKFAAWFAKFTLILLSTPPPTPPWIRPKKKNHSPRQSTPARRQSSPRKPKGSAPRSFTIPPTSLRWHKNSPYDENDRTNPLSAYGKTKLAGEQAIRESGAHHLIFRTAWVYSTRGKNFLLTILRLATERDELRIVNDQSAPRPGAAKSRQHPYRFCSEFLIEKRSRVPGTS